MRKTNLLAVCSFVGMVILILDTKTAITSAAEGVTLCLQTVIPSVFPFMVLSIMAASTFPEWITACFGFLGRLLRISKGSECMVLVGLLGGYPTGAAAVAKAWQEQRISPINAGRMLAFVSNAGPAFLFGFGAHIFQDKALCWYLWGIHILSAWIVGLLTPGKDDATFSPPDAQIPSLSSTMLTATKTMAMVCGWIVLFRVILAFCQRWFLWRLPIWANVLVQGLLELSNGTLSLCQIQDPRLRLVLFSGMLGFGGLCVAMQTFALCRGMDTGHYLPGKLLQALLSMLLSAMIMAKDFGKILTFGVIVFLVCLGYYFFSKAGKKTGFPAHSGLQ